MLFNYTKGSDLEQRCFTVLTDQVELSFLIMSLTDSYTNQIATLKSGLLVYLLAF